MTLFIELNDRALLKLTWAQILFADWKSIIPSHNCIQEVEAWLTQNRRHPRGKVTVSHDTKNKKLLLTFIIIRLRHQSFSILADVFQMVEFRTTDCANSWESTIWIIIWFSQKIAVWRVDYLWPNKARNGQKRMRLLTIFSHLGHQPPHLGRLWLEYCSLWRRKSSIKNSIARSTGKNNVVFTPKCTPKCIKNFMTI